MKKAVVVGVVVLGVAWVGSAWYTGKQVEQVLQQSIADTNEQLQKLPTALGMSIALASFDRGVFTSTATYSVKFKGGEQAAKDELLFEDHIEHGPFPVSRLKAGRFAPTMVTSNYSLIENDTAKPWFAAAKGAVPLAGTADVSYSRDVAGTMRFAPVDFTREGNEVKFSGMNIDASQVHSTKETKVSGQMENLILAGTHEGEAYRVTLQGFALDTHSVLGAAGVKLGTDLFSVKQLVATVGKKPPMQVDNFSQKLEVTEAAGGVGGRLAYDVGAIKANGLDFTGAQLVMTAKNLDPKAVQALSQMYSKIVMRSGGNDADAMELTPEEQQTLQTNIELLLAGNPSVGIDPLLLKATGGETRFVLNLDLTKPAQAGMPFAQSAMQMIRKLNASLVLNKPMVAGILAQQATSVGMPADRALAQAKSQAEMMGGIAMASGLAKVDGDNVVTALNYADGQVELNGQKMPVDQFVSMLMRAVMVGGRVR